VFTTIISIAAPATTQRATALSAGDPPPRQRSQPLWPHWFWTTTPP
jgi:hypothetical protein